MRIRGGGFVQLKLAVVLAAGLAIVAAVVPSVVIAGPMFLEPRDALASADLAVTLLGVGLYLIGLAWIREIATEEV